jgi:hypothetical protein
VRQMERYWLCDACCSRFTLTFERGRGMITVPLPARTTPVPGAHLRQMQPTLKVYRAELKGALMNHFRTPLCAICGQEQSRNQPRFLIAESTWEDKLTILPWNEHMASRAGIQAACSIDHVEELGIIPSREPRWAPQPGDKFRRQVAGLTSAGHGLSGSWRSTATAWNGC